MYYDSKSGKLPRKTQSCANIFKEDNYEVYEKDYSDFVGFLNEISSRYGAVVLLRYMSKELSIIIKLKTMVDNGVSLPTAINMFNVRRDYRLDYIVENISLDVLVKFNESLLYHYDSLMNNSFNSSIIVDSFFTSVWRLVRFS